jgi:hypothetical protein
MKPRLHRGVGFIAKKEGRCGDSGQKLRGIIARFGDESCCCCRGENLDSSNDDRRKRRINRDSSFDENSSRVEENRINSGHLEEEEKRDENDESFAGQLFPKLCQKLAFLTFRSFLSKLLKRQKLSCRVEIFLLKNLIDFSAFSE